jgi:hypothetical protein
MRVLFADDKSNVEGGTVQDGLRRALALINSRIELDFVAEENRGRALDLLQDDTQVWDLVLIDVWWASILQGSESDAAGGLLRAALKRPATVTILISWSADPLLDYLYNLEKQDRRPHAVITKSQAEQEMIFAGVLEAAFSARLMPLRSWDVAIEWNPEQSRARSFFRAVKSAAAELACLALPTADEVRLSPVSGGLSEAITILAEGSIPSGGTVRRQAQLLKLAQDPAVIAAEQEAHRRHVPYFPLGTFARPIGNPPLTYDGWTAIGFEVVDGSTVSAMGEQALSEGTWRQIFRDVLLQAYVANGVATSLVLGQAVTGDGGLLGARRWDRIIKETGNLQLSDDERRQLSGPAASLFPLVQRQTALTVVHGDLHTRNVLVRGEGLAFLVDAASIRTDGLWCEDLCRFSVWLACELLERTGARLTPQRRADALAHSLALRRMQRGTAGWAETLRARVSASASQFEELWKRRGLPLHVEYDRTIVTCVELLRAGYCRDSFDPVVRLAAVQVALASLANIGCLESP